MSYTYEAPKFTVKVGAPITQAFSNVDTFIMSSGNNKR